MEDKDINDAFEDIFLVEDRLNQEAYVEGFTKGRLEGNPEGYHLGYHRGAELGAELGYYLGAAKWWLDEERKVNEKIKNQLENLIKLIENFPKSNDENFDILGQADVVRGLYRKICSLLKIDGKFPENNNLSF